MNNRLPLDPTHLARALHADTIPDVDTLLRVGWLVPIDISCVEARKYLSSLDVRIRTKSYESVPREEKSRVEKSTCATHTAEPSVDNSVDKGAAYCAARYLPIIRAQLRPGQPHDRPTESRDVTICVQMIEKGADPDEVEDAIRGLAWLRDHGAIDWLEKGKPVTMRALYNTRSGLMPVWQQAVHAAHKHIHGREPERGRKQPRPFTVTIDQGAA